MFTHIAVDELYLIGDIIDGQQMRKKERWNFADWHRQVVSHVCRMADRGTSVTYIPGNHDEDIRHQKVDYDGEKRLHRNLCGARIYKVSIEELAYFIDAQGRMLKLIHGDQYDRTLGKAGTLGDAALELLARADIAFQLVPRCQQISLAAKSKRATKKIVDRLWDIRKRIADEVDGNRLLDGIVTGHSHISEISRTPGGKLLLNDGCCTEHVEALVQDRDGKFAILEWHQSHIKITEEVIRKHHVKTQQRSVLWKELGLGEFTEPPPLLEDEYTGRADRLIRLFYRMWPPKERKNFKEAAALALAEHDAGGLANLTRRRFHKDWSLRKYRRVRRMAAFMRATGQIAQSTAYLPLPNPGRDRRQATARASPEKQCSNHILKAG